MAGVVRACSIAAVAQFAPAMTFRGASNGFTGLTTNISRVSGVFTNNSALLNSINTANTATSSSSNTANSALGNLASFTNLLPGLSRRGRRRPNENRPPRSGAAVGDEFLRQLTAEALVRKVVRGVERLEWIKAYGSNWRLLIRPPSDSASSPRWYDNAQTLLKDGVGNL